VARERPEVADVFRRFGQAFRDQHGASLSAARRRAMLAIERCRTAALGGHVERCDDCGHQRIAYNSCRNRNCPKCQGLARAQWLEDRQAELLDVPYFHVVFTVPEAVAPSPFRTRLWFMVHLDREMVPDLLRYVRWLERDAAGGSW
jgi:hypothetical protein